MAGSLILEGAIIFVLILANGFFAASEIAIVSARRGRLEQQAHAGRRAAQQAYDLSTHPDRFLATVQVGITLISTLAAAFGGSRMSATVAGWLATVPGLAAYADPIAFSLVVVLITYFTLVLGELAPKQLALASAERIAIFVSPLMAGLAIATRPVILLLTASVNVVLRLLRQHAIKQEVTEEDVIYLAREGAIRGSVESGEEQLIERVFRFTDRLVRSVMTPRTEIVAVEADQSLQEVAEIFQHTGYSRLPVYQDTLDNVVGIVFAKDLLRLQFGKGNGKLMQLVRPASFVVENQHVDDLLNTFRRQGSHLALVVDEYGQITGLITLEDVLEELVGDIEDEFDVPEDRPIIHRPDGTWLVDGMEDYESVRERIGLPEVPEGERGAFTTLAGLIVMRLGRIPHTGDTITEGDFQLEVIDMDGRRIDKVLVRPQTPSQDETTG